MENKAKFTINGTPSTDPGSGDRIFIGTNGQTITVQLESSLGVSTVTYSLVDVADPSSPLSSLGAPQANFSVSGTPSESPTLPEQSSQFSLPASGVHTYLVRAAALLSNGTVETFERIVAITTVCGSRKTIPAERQEGNARGWSDVQNKQIDCEGGGGGGQWDFFLQNDVVTTTSTSEELFNFFPATGRSVTGRLELFAFETGTYVIGGQAILVRARLAFDFTFYKSIIHAGNQNAVGVMVTAIPAAIIFENPDNFATASLEASFEIPSGGPTDEFIINAVHGVGVSEDIKWCATLYGNECDGPIPDVTPS